MEIKKEVVMRRVAGEAMLIPVGGAVEEYNGIFSLSESAMFLFEGIKKGLSEDELVASLLEEYDTDEATARADCAEFLDSLREYGII